MNDDKASEARNDGSEFSSALKGLISFFTIWHMDITQEDMDNMDRNFHLVPIVGMLFAIVLMLEMVILVATSWYLGFGGTIIPIVALATVYVGSKFLHFDGLTDFGDGMIASGDQEKHVRALKDTLVGAGGVGVAIITILFALALYGSIGGLMCIIVIPLVEVLVKNAQVFAAGKGMPGNGMAGRQVSQTNRNSAISSFILSMALGIIIVLLGSAMIQMFAGHAPFSIVVERGLVALFIGLVVSSLTGIVMANIANRTFGMVNGDILGATNEISRVTTLFFMAFMLAGVV